MLRDQSKRLKIAKNLWAEMQENYDDPCSGEIVVFTNYEQAYPGHEKYLKGTFKVAWDLNMERHRAGQVLKTEIVRVDTPNNERDPMIDGTVLRINSYFEKLHQNEQNK